jgi:predicted nucleic acid-binding protein
VNLRGKRLTVLLDSWCWIEYFEGSAVGKKISKYIDSDQSIFISVINLAEVYKWSLSRKSEKDAESIVHIMLSRCFIVPVEPTIALNAAKTNWKKKWGLGDSLIYESAKARSLLLVTGDPHFKKEKEVVYFGR